MCGLFGWQWAEGQQPSPKSQGVLARKLAMGADERGGQSWGAWTPTLVMRGLGPSAAHAARMRSLPSLAGHSRWATHGDTSLENTHPFVRGGVTLAHNGVIYNHYDLNRDHKRNATVDSEHLLLHLVEGKPFTDLQGYGAIVWTFPSEPANIYLGRLSDSGQLTILKTSRGLVWASEYDVAQAACSAARLKVLASYNIIPGHTYCATDGKLYQDDEMPSILVSARTGPSWDSYTTGMAGGSGFACARMHASPGFPLRWCNMHKRSYSSCPCVGGVEKNPHVVACPAGVTPKVGETYTPPPAPTPTVRTCAESTCQKPAADSLWCAEHLAPPSPSSSDLLALWAGDADPTEEERRGTNRETQRKAAQWLESRHGFVNDVTGGMSGSEVLDLALDMGFADTYFT